MWTWYTFWLLLHIMGAVVAFGPIFTYPMVATMARRRPQHGAFATQVIVNMSERYTLPGAVSMLVSGIGLMVVTDTGLGDNGWLIAALVLYVLAVTFSVTQQVPAGKRMASLQSAPPPPGAAGPPPEIATLGKRLAMGGGLLTLAVVAIFVLMIWRPGG